MELILCAGLQSGGTTLVSWCFLQRQDTNGVLDMRNDCFYASPPEITEPILWIKMTVGAFRWLDVNEMYLDLGWDVKPLLVARDVRAVYASLLNKSYGFNGTTAEEPPLRMRFRRFLRDWELFRANSWPILRFEDLLENGEDTLKKCCQSLLIDWDPGMINWPKTTADVAHMSPANATFRSRMDCGGLGSATDKEKMAFDVGRIPPSELAWLNTVFADYNVHHGYPPQIIDVGPSRPGWIVPPEFAGTKRQRISSAVQHLDWIPRLMDPALAQSE